jgi:hypothetical protein
MRPALVVAGLLALAPLAPVSAQAATTVSIGINLGAYPRLVPVPGYPVYYAPAVNSNYFFYDGLYWNFDGANWYSAAWYNGPWTPVDPYAVPVYLLQVPVRYYHSPPVWFHGWAVGEAPHWHEHWGPAWAERRHDWDSAHHDWNRGHWDEHNMPARAPLPTYQRNYSGNRYPQPQQQVQYHNQNYHYAPHEQVVQQHYSEHGYQAHAQKVDEHHGSGHDNRGHEEHHDHDHR